MPWEYRCSDFCQYADSWVSIPDLSTFYTHPDHISIIKNRINLTYSLSNLMEYARPNTNAIFQQLNSDTIISQNVSTTQPSLPILLLKQSSTTYSKHRLPLPHFGNWRNMPRGNTLIAPKGWGTSSQLQPKPHWTDFVQNRTKNTPLLLHEWFCIDSLSAYSIPNEE